MTPLSDLLTKDRLTRLIKAVEKMRKAQTDYYIHHVSSSKPKMLEAQRTVDGLLKCEKEFINSKQIELI